MQGESEEGEEGRRRRAAPKKGGSTFIPTLKGGDFPLRPLHPRKLKTRTSRSRPSTSPTRTPSPKGKRERCLSLRTCMACEYRSVSSSRRTHRERQGGSGISRSGSGCFGSAEGAPGHAEINIAFFRNETPLPGQGERTLWG